jgi:Flp pilus assembly protein TadG
MAAMTRVNRVLERQHQVLDRQQSRLRSERGAELVEFALTLPLLLLLVLGIIEFGFLFQEYEVVTNAAREGARIGALIPSAGYTSNEAKARITDYLTAGGLDLAKATPVPTVVQSQIAIAGTGKCIPAVTATVTYQHPVPFLSGIVTYFNSALATIPLKSVAIMRTEGGSVACP